MTYYPGIEEVISAHSRLIARFGGTLGIRDRDALESALARPAALWESLSQNHPFLDGNKRGWPVRRAVDAIAAIT